MVVPSEGNPNTLPDCTTCGRTYDWHVRNQGMIKHPYNDGSVPVSTTFGKRKDPRDKNSHTDGTTPATPAVAAWPFDPVLRQALIDKGILTPDDLTHAEAKIRTVFSVEVAAMNDGQ